MSDDRLRRLEELRGGLWVRYPRAEAILKKLEDLYALPRYHRMPHFLLVGDTNNGKTMIATRFSKQHPPANILNRQEASAPVVMIQAPPVPDEGRFYSAILKQIYAPLRISSRNDQRQLEVQSMLDLVGTRVLIIDEIQHVLAGTMAKQRQFLNVLKHLGNELKLSIVAVGTRDAFNVIQNDPQLANRFEPALLPRWKLDGEYLSLLAAIEPLLMLKKPAALVSPEIATAILSLSEGTIGEICQLIQLAAKYVLHTGGEEITKAALDVCGYTPPSQRRHPIEV